MSSTILWIIIAILGSLLGASIYYNVKFGLLILRTQDALEDALDVLDQKYQKISEILQIPLFYDSQEVRQVLDDIDASREAILSVARELTTIEEISVDPLPTSTGQVE